MFPLGLILIQITVIDLVLIGGILNFFNSFLKGFQADQWSFWILTFSYLYSLWTCLVVDLFWE